MSGILALLGNNWRILRNLRRILREQSRLKVAFILVFAAGLVAGMWALFFEGFLFISRLGGVGLMIVHRLFNLFFFGLGAMLVLSSLITSYATLFCSDEIAFLLMRPLRRSEVVVHKFIESAVLSSWAFFFMIIPFVGAFGWFERLPAWFTIMTLVFSVPFVLLCSAIGTLLIVAVVRFLPRLRPLHVGAFALACVIGAVVWMSSSGRIVAPDETNFVLARLVPGLRLASYPLWPSWWVGEGILAASRGQWARSAMLWALLAVNLIVAFVFIEVAGELFFYDGWQKCVGAAARTRRASTLFARFDRMLFFLPSDIRALVMKDLRCGMRDSVQWTQGLLFFGLLGIYFVNLRNLHYHMLEPVWRNMIAFLNVFSLSAVMCSFCSRFVYPQLSMEGHGFWVVGLSPTTMTRVLVAKFVVAAVGMLALSLTLMSVSTGMLGVSRSVRLSALAIAAAMSLALSGLATGLGAVFLDLKQRNPMAVISGFGGTLNLVLSLGFMLAAIVPFAFVYHQYALKHIRANELAGWIWLCSAWLGAVTAAAVLAPMAAARKSLAVREY